MNDDWYFKGYRLEPKALFSQQDYWHWCISDGFTMINNNIIMSIEEMLSQHEYFNDSVNVQYVKCYCCIIAFFSMDYS